MNRRKFLSTTVFTLPGMIMLQNTYGSPRTKNNQLLNAYYFRAHMYTLVPYQIREDLKWMQDVGTQAVSIAVLEQDLFAAVENIDIICNEASKLGIGVFAVPSRWAGLFAGAPKVPSLFSVQNPQTWVLEKNGQPKFTKFSGVISSIHYDETFEFFQSNIDKMFKLWNLKGVIWDEPKMLQSKDYSGKAIEKLGKEASLKDHVKAFTDFMSKLNLYIKTNYPAKRTCLFGYAHLDDWQIELAAKIEGLDDFGCDGRPWYDQDGGKQEENSKVLLGQNRGERFLYAAKKHGKNSLWLIENHNMALSDIPLLEKRFPEVLKKEVNHLIYYYYPRNLEDPDKVMETIKKHLSNRKYGKI